MISSENKDLTSSDRQMEGAKKKAKKPSKKSPNIGIFGTKGSGKTTYLVSLINEMYNFAVSDKWEMNITGESHKFYVDKIKQLENGEWLAGTRDHNYLDFKMVHSRKGSEIHIQTADIVGESFKSAFDPCNEEQEDQGESKLLEMITNCRGYIFVIDPARLVDPQRKIEEISIYRSLIEFLRESRGLKGREKFDEPFAFVFTKSDKYAEFVGRPKKFFYNKMRAIHGKCDSLMKQYKTFSCSSVGGIENREGKEYPATPIEPQRVFQPFQWVRDRVLKL